VVLFVHNTSRVADEPYPTLLREKGFNAFPSLCFLDADGNVLVKQGERSVKGFAATLQRLQRIDELRKQAASGGADAQRDLFLAELELGSLRADEIRARMDKLHLDDATRARVDRHLVDAELRELAARQRELGEAAFGDAVAAIAKSGRRPTDAMATPFWQTTLTWCSTHGEPQLAQTAHDELLKRPLAAAVKRRYDEQLEQARAAGKK
jgi:hypothetical protein